ncbi:MAG: LolA family protein [Candidatus Anammoxibacter sp.]
MQTIYVNKLRLRLHYFYRKDAKNAKIRLSFLCVLCVFAVNFLFFTGCASHKRSLLRPIPVTDQEVVKRIRDTIISNENNILSIKAHADIKIRSSALRVPIKFNGILRYKRPNALRLIANKFSYTIFDMTYNTNQLSFYVPTERKVFLGTFDKTTKIDVTGITFKPYDIVNIFNFSDMLNNAELYLEQDRESLIMHVYDPDYKPKRLLAYIYINKMNNISMYQIFDATGELMTVVTFDKYRKIEGCNVPHRVEIKWVQDKTSIVFIFDNLSVNQELSDKMFNITLPENTEIVPIGNLY